MRIGTAKRITKQAEVERLVTLFECIAEQEGWQPGDQLRAHLSFSAMFGLFASGGELIGGLQLVRADFNGRLPSHAVWPELTFDRPTEVAHIGVLAVETEWRGRDGGLFWLLTAEMWRYCVLERIREIWLEATPRTLRCYQRLGWPLKIRGPLREHWGELCFICSLDIREVAGSLAEKAIRSKSYREILTGAVSARMPLVGSFK